MNEFREFFTDKKNIATLTTLLLMVVILPLGIALIRSQQIFFSKASGEHIQVGTGKCVTEKDGKKVLTCNEIPLLLNAPFDPNATPEPSVAVTASPAAFNPSNMMSKISTAVVPEARGYDKHICSGDTTPGVGGLIDIVVNGCGEALNYDAIYHSCVSSATIQYKPPVWNASKHEWETIKQDGTVISQAKMIEKSQNDGRFPIALSSTDNPPWINCEVYFEYSGRNDCNVTPQKNAAGQPMGREGTELDSGQTFTMDVAKTSNPASGDPDCKQQVQVELKAAATPTPTPTPTPTATPAVTASPTSSPTGTSSPAACVAGTFSSAQLETPNGCGSIISQPTVGNSSGVITYKAPDITSDLSCNLKVVTGNNGDCTLNAGSVGTASNPLKPNETMNINFVNSCSDNTAGCQLPIIISGALAIPTDKAAYKLAESENALNAANERGFTTQAFPATYILKDTKPGLKQIWVEFNNKQTGTKTKDFLNIELVESKPLIKTATCDIDISKTAVNFDLTGLRFGTEKGTASSNGSELDISSWSSTNVKGTLKNASLADGDQSYKMKVTRKDGDASEEVECKLGVAQISLGTQLICRGEGKMDLSNVTVTIVDELGKKVEETGSINKDGIITGLKTKFEIGKNYSVSIKASKILRRTITFKAAQGTTVITKDDGTKLQLPVGDIYPGSSGGDGVINALDQSELMRQWRIVDALSTSLSGDFNDDKRVNAFDWSCMRQSFGSSNEDSPTSPSSGTISVEFNTIGGTNSVPLTVEFGVPESNQQAVPQVPASTPDGIPKIFIQGH